MRNVVIQPWNPQKKPYKILKTTGNVWDSVLALASYHEGKLYPCGTAFLIGNGLALSSSHIFEKPFDKTFDGDYKRAKSNYSLIGFQRIKNYENALNWQIESAHFIPIQEYKENDDRPLDITLLKIKPHYPKTSKIEKYRYQNFELNISPPKIGDRVVGYGFPNSKIEEVKEPNTYEFDNHNRKTEGVVTKIFFPHRDKGFLAFPCFELEGEFEHGMSGGPIFNDVGQVCGVITSSGLKGISYGSVLWPALGIKIDGKYLLDHAKQNKIHVSNYECVNIHERKGRRFPDISFQP